MRWRDNSRRVATMWWCWRRRRAHRCVPTMALCPIAWCGIPASSPRAMAWHGIAGSCTGCTAALRSTCCIVTVSIPPAISACWRATRLRCRSSSPAMAATSTKAAACCASPGLPERHALAVKEADALVAISGFVRDGYRRLHPEATPHDIPNGVDVARLRATRRAARQTFPPTSRRANTSCFSAGCRGARAWTCCSMRLRP